jgi:hypothetical protein
MTEDEARDLLRTFDSFDRLEGWLADQPWQAAPDGWAVDGMLQGWTFRIAVAGDGLRLTAGVPGTKPAVWQVMPR